MAIDKDPSIYRDRGMIGSSEELDEYGVWVKSEPEDLASAHGSAAPIEEPTLPDIEDLPDLEFDSAGDFDLSESSAEKDAAKETEETAPVAKEEEKQDFAIDEPSSAFGEELPSFEDIASFDAEIPPVSSEDFTELSMDDFLETETADVSGSGTEDETMDIDLDFQDSTEPSQGMGETEDFGFQIEDETPAAEEMSDSDISLESVSDFDDFLNDLSDTEAPSQEPSAVSAAAETPAADIEEKIEVEDISIDVEESEPLTVAFEPVEESADIILSGFEATDGEEEPPSAQEEPFDDIAALSRDLQESESSAAPAADAGLSTQLLMRIADELSSIKTELSSLKEELSVLRGDAKVDAGQEKAVPASHGFFDEEDDEKIALTGDELDNILNTADFTEEAGADATADLSDEAVIDDFLMDREDLLGDEGTSVGDEGADMREAIEPTEAAFLDEPPAPADDLENADFGLPGDDEFTSEETIERIELGDEPAEPLPEELQKLQVTGVIPMTPAPEDTSYLEADEPTVPADDLETPTDDLGAPDIDLTEAVIDEPDLGGAIFEEAPIEEPSIDAIHLDLDMEESLDIETEEPAGEESEGAFENIELTLDEYVGEEAQESEAFEPTPEIIEDEETEEPEAMPAAEESFAEVVPEGFVVEPDETQEPIIGEEEQTEPIETVDLAEEPQEEESQPLPVDIRQEVRAVLSYMDQLLESLPEDKIEEFAKSEYFDTYKKLFEELGLV